MIVAKFGGTSVGSGSRIRAVGDIVAESLSRKPVVVVSAAGGVTDRLLAAARHAMKLGTIDLGEIETLQYGILDGLSLDRNLVASEFEELHRLLRALVTINDDSPKVMDRVVSFGERISAKIVAAHFRDRGIASKSLTPQDIGLVTDSHYGAAEPLPEAEENIRSALEELEAVPVVTGFIGVDRKGHLTTLGRGGSDYSAAIIGAAMGAEEIQIWTDVSGIMTADPRIVKNARTIDRVSFDEAAELATFGAKVLHPKTIVPAVQKNIPVRILNSFAPREQGTLIVADAVPDRGITALSARKNITLLNIVSTRMLLAHGFMARLFEIFNRNRVSVDMVATSEVSVSLTLDPASPDAEQEIVDEIRQFSGVNIKRHKAILCLVSARMKEDPQIPARTFSTLARNGIPVEMISQGASRVNLGVVIDNRDADRTLNLLHQEFFDTVNS
ncbi:MAG: aspartate kinase [Bacteroidota bacterium]